MSIVITGDISWTGALVLFLEALDGGPVADTDGYAFTSSGDMEYSCTVTDAILGLYRCVAKTSGGVIAGAGYVTIETGATSVRIRSEEATGSDATLAKQEEILAAIDDLAAVQLAAVEVEAGTISGFPETLTIGDSYSEDTGQIRINITDSTSGDPIDSLGSLEFVDAYVAFTAFRPNDSARIVGNCQYVREPSSGTLTASYVLVTLLTSETSKGKAEYTYEGRLKFVWQGPSSSDETDEEQKTYKTTPFKFIANP